MTTNNNEQEREVKPRLDAHFSVFNCHLNNAKERADKEFIAQFGQEAFDKEIAPFHEGGIMWLFNRLPNKYTGPWVTLVTAYVNEDREIAAQEQSQK